MTSNSDALRSYDLEGALTLADLRRLRRVLDSHSSPPLIYLLVAAVALIAACHLAWAAVNGDLRATAMAYATSPWLILVIGLLALIIFSWGHGVRARHRDAQNGLGDFAPRRINVSEWGIKEQLADDIHAYSWNAFRHFRHANGVLILIREPESNGFVFCFKEWLVEGDWSELIELVSEHLMPFYPSDAKGCTGSMWRP